MTNETFREMYSRPPTAEEIQTEIDNLRVEAGATIAYTVGSFWYCPTHGEGIEGAQPVSRANTMAIYHYKCDECGAIIQRKLIDDDQA